MLEEFVTPSELPVRDRESRSVWISLAYVVSIEKSTATDCTLHYYASLLRFIITLHYCITYFIASFSFHMLSKLGLSPPFDGVLELVIPSYLGFAINRP